MNPRPTWENTFNGELRRKVWGSIGYALDHARRGGYAYLLWDRAIYLTSAPYTKTKYRKRHLYEEDNE